MTLAAHWPVVDLRITTPTLELRWPDLDDLTALATLAAKGVHDPAVQPFSVEWTDGTPEERARRALTWHWRCLGEWRPEAWALNFVVVQDGEVVGSQTVAADNFAIRREVRTGSWLGIAHHGRGIGTEMRAAVLHLAFAHLGAETAVSGAFLDNVASTRVSRRLGYEVNGVDVHVVRGKRALQHRFRLTRTNWQPRHDISVSGVSSCLDFLDART
ncbi:GNAT family N-acetyltransferase [Nocardia camponoti]|uniref:Succinyl-CoA transferase n=1 Tax=Nocardia camponoti TaxID=1616106 RepID=A0A917Q9A4_9NOCA|nr:GNAT family N-acetyltransferase [Nocardia camponoti]GGK35963.1 putative succinyl-CoA transferase [Nocardia camponoti]